LSLSFVFQSNWALVIQKQLCDMAMNLLKNFYLDHHKGWLSKAVL